VFADFMTSDLLNVLLGYVRLHWVITVIGMELLMFVQNM